MTKKRWPLMVLGMACGLFAAAHAQAPPMPMVDGDADGVPDDIDECPYTPPGTLVDAKGCPLSGDADHDGVPDSMDDCPFTPPGAVVDAHGCAMDSDFDGVPDGIDQCPHTPFGEGVDARGCADGEKPSVAPRVRPLTPALPVPPSSLPRPGGGQAAAPSTDHFDGGPTPDESSRPVRRHHRPAAKAPVAPRPGRDAAAAPRPGPKAAPKPPPPALKPFESPTIAAPLATPPPTSAAAPPATPLGPPAQVPTTASSSPPAGGPGHAIPAPPTSAPQTAPPASPETAPATAGSTHPAIAASSPKAASASSPEPLTARKHRKGPTSPPIPAAASPMTHRSTEPSGPPPTPPVLVISQSPSVPEPQPESSKKAPVAPTEGVPAALPAAAPAPEAAPAPVPPVSLAPGPARAPPGPAADARPSPRPTEISAPDARPAADGAAGGADLRPTMSVTFAGKGLSAEAKAELRAFGTVAIQHFLASPNARLLIVSAGPRPDAATANAGLVRDYLASNGVTATRIDIHPVSERSGLASARLTVSP